MSPPVNNTFDILLYQPRSAYGKHRVPMSLLALGSMLEQRFKYAIVDGNFFHAPLAQLPGIIEKSGCSILGMTVMPGPQLHEAIPLARTLRSRFPKLQIIWGGYFASNHPEVVLRSGWVDFVLRGPAEHEFVELVELISNGAGDKRRIRGLSFLENGRIIHNPQRVPPAPLDDLPAWPYHRLGDMQRYLGRTYLGRRTTSMHTSYGCPFTCSFCAVVPIYEGAWVGRNASLVANDVEDFVKRHGADAVEFCDNNFFTSRKRTAQFSDELLRRDLKISWWGEGRPDTLEKYPDEVLSSMRRSGCKMVFLGAESGSALRLKQMNKGGTQTPETILRLAERFRTHDIIPEFSFVLGAPADDVGAAIDEDLRFIRRVKKVNPRSEIIIYVYSAVPLEGSSLLNDVKAAGFAFPEKLEDWLSPPWRQHDLRRAPFTPWLKPFHLDKIHNFETILNARYPTVSDINLTPLQRALLKTTGTWRYATGVQRAPYEIKLLQRLMRYRQPELEGF